jgi:microcystin-dependent protein
MSAPFMGEVRVFAGTFAPIDWVFCNGQSLAISQYDALYALLGTTYGGDGVNTFNAPDARGRIPVGQGTGPGLTARIQGQMYGTETVTLLSTQIPAHTHTVAVSNTEANLNTPSGQLVGQGYHYFAPTTPVQRTGQLLPNAIGNTGGSQSHENMMPFLAMSFILCLQGIFPSRN